MKRIALLLITLVAVVALGYRLAAPSRTGILPVTSPAGILPAALPTTTNTNSTEVFQKAFWKRPTAEDKILHAERREWADSHGIRQWQWFIEVQPSAALVKHLRDDNAFNLVPASNRAKIEQAPAWFIAGDENADVRQAPHGNLCLIFNTKTNTLLATDAGDGFKPGAPEPAKPFPQTASMGRLPTTPPPKP